jgi:hypothetical protein
MSQKFNKIIFGNESKIEGNILYVNESDFEIPHGTDYNIAIKELYEIQKCSVNGIHFLELFQYDNFSMWWFIYQSLIPKYKQITNFINKFLELIKFHNPSQITIIDNYSNFSLIQQICKQKNVKLNYSKISLFSFSKKYNFKHSAKKTKYAFFLKNKINKRKKMFKDKNRSIPDISNKIIFATPTAYRRNITNHKEGTSSRGEYIQQNIIELIDKKNQILGMDLDYTFKGDHDIFAERLSDSTKWIPFEILINSNKSSNHSEFLNKLIQIIENEEFQKLFHFQNISLWSLIKPFFDEMFLSPYLPFYLKIIDSLSEIFEKTPPKAIFLPYETGPIALSIIIASEKFDIKTIGLQHGYIYPGNPMYNYYNFRQKTSLMGFPIPKNMLVFGEYVKKMLSDIGYPEERLIIFGNSNFFQLQEIKKLLQQRSLHKKYNIDKNQKIILFATGKLQPFYSSHGKYDYDVKIWENLLKNYKNDKNVFLILKPHPTEKNISVYENLISKFSTSNARIIDGDLFELLSISSVIITVFSSVIIDSLCLKKSVIRIKFPGDVNSIFDESNAIITTDLNSLHSYIKELFSSKQLSINLEINSEKFVKNHYGIPEENPKNILETIIELN